MQRIIDSVNLIENRAMLNNTFIKFSILYGFTKCGIH